MERDPNVIVLGEDIVGGMGTAGGPEAIGGIWGTTGGLFGKFGADRVIDTPISESAIIGAAAGAALAGKRPVAEIMFADFVGVCLDQIWNQMAKFRYMFGGKTKCPAVIRLIYGAGLNAAAQHSQAVYPMLTAMPGLKVVLPTTPADAKGLLTEAIRGDDPVIFLEHKSLYGVKGEVPEGEHRLPFGHARMVREGGDVTIVTFGRMVSFCEKAADKLAQEGIGCDVIDLRTTSPLDEEAILDSVEQTGRADRRGRKPAALLPGHRHCRARRATRRSPASRRRPQWSPRPHTPVPFARELERAWLPSPRRSRMRCARRSLIAEERRDGQAQGLHHAQMGHRDVGRHRRRMAGRGGRAFAKGEVLALIETDKITNEVEAEAPGTLRAHRRRAGRDLPVGALLAVLGDGGEASAAEIDAFIAGFKPADTSFGAAATRRRPRRRRAPACACAPPARRRSRRPRDQPRRARRAERARASMSPPSPASGGRADHRAGRDQAARPAAGARARRPATRATPADRRLRLAAGQAAGGAARGRSWRARPAPGRAAASARPTCWPVEAQPARRSQPPAPPQPAAAPRPRQQAVSKSCRCRRCARRSRGG